MNMNLRQALLSVWLMTVAVGAWCQSIIPMTEWEVDLSQPAKSKSIEIVKGSSRNIRPTVKYGSSAWVFPTNATVVLRYKTAAMTNSYYSITGSVYSATGGVLNALWTPTNEGTNDAYKFEIEAATGTTAQISLYGTIFLKDSLATYSSGTAISQTNYPWTDDITVESNARIAGDLANSNNVDADISIHNTSTVAHLDIRGVIGTETTNRVAGDLAGSNYVDTLAASISNGFLRVIDSGGGVWVTKLPGE